MESDYPEWSKISNIEKGIQPASFDQTAFFKELKEIEKNVREETLTTESSKTLWQAGENFQLLKKLLIFELTSDEYELILKNAEVIDPGKLVSALETISGNRSVGDIQKAADYLEKEKALYLEFYALAQKRDRAFMRNIDRILKDNHPLKAVLITGGFHSKHLGELFKEKGISRVLISPEISKIDDSVGADYEKILREKTKSTLRAPATLGTPFFIELKNTLEREQSRVLENHVKRLIGYLDVDKFLQKPLAKPVHSQGPRSELRTIQAFVSVFADLSNSGAAVLGVGLAGLGILGAGLGWYLLKMRQQKARPVEALVPVVPPIPSMDLGQEPAFEQDDNDLLGGFEEDLIQTQPLMRAVERPAAKPADPAKAFASQARRFFEASFPVIPSQEDLPPPPYELPLPVPAEAIPADQDDRGKVLYILQEVFQAMETMDGHMRSQQKESAERALRRILGEGDVDPQKYRNYLQEDLHQFFRGVTEEVKRMNAVPQEAAPLTVSDEINESYARFPRLVKHLLSENPALLEDREIKTLISRISGKFTARPPVAEDLETYVEQAYRRLNGHATQPPAIQQNVVAPTVPQPVSRQPAPTIQPPAPKKKVDFQRIAAQLRDLERMREKLESDQRKLSVDIQRTEREQGELQESLNQARQQRDQVIEEALQPSLQAYTVRLQKLSSSRDELAARLVQIGTEEDRLRGILEEGEDDGAARSEMRTLPPIFSISIVTVGIGLVAAGMAYAAAAYKAHRNANALIQENKGNWQFERGRIYKETVPVKDEEKLNLLKGDNAAPFIGLGVLAGWVIGGIILYHAYYSWDWASKVLWEAAQNYQGKKESLTLGALLWLGEIFGAPFIGALLGYVTAFLIQTITNFTMVAYRTLIFPFDYERALRLHILPFESLSASEIEKSAKFLSRMERETLEVILQSWVEKGEHQKIKAFSEKGIWKGDKQKFIHLYEDVAGLEQAKELLVRSFASKDEHKETIAEIVRRWKAALDKKKFNGSRLLKDLIPELVKSEKKFKEVRGWIERLILDPSTPWQTGFSQVKAHYEVLKQLEHLKNEASRKFSLNPEDITHLDSQVEVWKGRIPSSANKSTAAIQLLAAILGKAVQISPNKAWFSLSLKKISEIDSAFFNPSKQKDLLARFDQVIGFEMMKGRLLGEADAEEKKTFVSEFAAIETHLKSKGVDAAVALTTPFIRLRDLPKGHRIAVLQRFRGLDGSIYKKEAAQVSHAFDALTANESAKAKLLALGNGAPQSIREIESKAVLTSVEDINNLSGFYSVLAEKTTPPVQSFMLHLAARAPPAVLPVFVRSRDSLVGYYSAHPTGRDYENLPRLADEYRSQYGSLQILTFPLLDLLTDSGKSPKDRLEEARRTIAGQTLVRLGFPENVIETRDVVSVEEMIQALSSNGGEELLSKRAKQTVVKKALSKMGRLGLYSYWESGRPAYYLQFLEETKGIDPAFFKPGEKIRVSYDGETPVQRKAGSLSPIENPVQAMQSLIRTLRLKHPNIYDNFIGPKRELLQGKFLEDVVHESSYVNVASQFKRKVSDWPFPEKEKTEMTLRVHEILFSNELQPLLGQKTAEEETAYWKEMLRLFGQKSGLKKDSDLSRSVVALIKKRIDELTAEAGTGREGVVQFILTRGTISDFVRGEISEDCCAEHRNLHFNDTVALPTDPAFLSFKLVENGKWIGNIYSMILKDGDGKFIFYLDNMPVRMSHQLTNNQAKADKLINGFYQKLKELLETSGFDYFVMAPDPSSREKIRTALNALGGDSQSKPTSKPGGYGHKPDFEAGAEYVQGLGTLSSSINANGKWIALDNRAVREKRRELEIQELQKLHRQVETERKRLEKQRTEKTAQIKHLKESSQDAAEGSKLATAQVLIAAAKKEEVELSRITEEIKGLDSQAVSTKARLEELRTATQSRSELRAISPILGQLLPGNGLIEFLIFASFVGIVGWIGWILLRGWLAGPAGNKPEPMTRPEIFPAVPKSFDSPLIPSVERPVWHRHPLVVEVTDLFKLVLKKVSDEMRPLMPRRLFFPIPMDMGMKIPQEIIRALTTARTVLKLLRDHHSLIPFLRGQAYYRDFKKRTATLGLKENFDSPGSVSTFQMKTRGGKEVSFSLELSERTSDDLLRGDVSHDCTGLGACAAFYDTIPQFLLDPGFLNFKLRMDGKWVGNIYMMVAEREGTPVLVVDAVQFPPAQNAWPVHPIAIAQATVNEISKWAEEQNFDQVVMSSFVSNFTYLYDYFNFQYPRQAMVIEKTGGFEHLKSLGFWDDKNARNQYVETYSPHWNQPLEGVDANNPKQILYLRPIWTKDKPDISTSQTARSEMRSNQNWKIGGFDLEVPTSDIDALKVIPGSNQNINQMILGQTFESKSLKISAGFIAAGYELGMKIRVRVHDEENGDRIFKFIIVTSKGRRNFILKVDQQKTQFWHEYSEDLNLLDTALMTAQDQGRVVGLRNIFAKSGDPSDPQGHEIPFHGMIYVEQEKQVDPEKQVKVFDLKIKGHEKLSIRAAIKPATETQKETFAEAKAVYVFRWDEKKYLLGIYAPRQKVKLALPVAGAEPLEPLASLPEIFEDTSISLAFFTPPSTVAAPAHEELTNNQTQPPVVVEEPRAPEYPASIPIAEEPSTPKHIIPETVSSTARAGFVGLGSEIMAQARRITSNARIKKIEEKVSMVKKRVEDYKTQVNSKSAEAQKLIQELPLDLSASELLARIAVLDKQFQSDLSAGHKEIQDEIEGYNGIPELELFYQSLQKSAAEIEGNLQTALTSILEAKKEKLAQKAEFSKAKIQKIADGIIQSVSTIRSKIEAIPLDLSPKEIIHQTQSLEDELMGAIESGLPPIQEEVQSYNLEGLQSLHQELTAFAEQTQRGVLDRLNALEEETTDSKAELVKESAAEKFQDVKIESEAGSLSGLLATDPNHEILPNPNLEPRTQELGHKAGEIEALKQEEQILKAQIQKEREEVTALERNRLKILGELEALDAQKIELETGIAGFKQGKTQKLALTLEVSDLEKQIKDKRTDLDALNEELSKSKGEQQELVTLTQALDGETEKKRNDLSKIEIEKETAARQLEVLKEKIAEADHKSSALSEKEVLLKTVNNQLEEQEQKLLKKRQQIDETNRLLGEGQAALKALEDETENRRKVLQGLTKSAKDLKDQITLQNKELATLRKNQTQITEDIQHLINQKQTLEGELKEYESIQAKREQSTKELEQVQLLREQTEREHKELMVSNSQETERLERLRIQIAQADEAIKVKELLLRDLEKKETEQSVLMQEIERLDGQLQEKRASLQSLASELSELEGNLHSLREENESLTQSVENLRQNLASLEMLQTQAQSDYEQIQSTIKQARENLDGLPEQEQKLINITQELAQKEEAVALAAHQIDEKTAVSQDLDRQLIAKAEEIQTRSKELQSIEDKLALNTKAEEKLNGQLSLFRNQVQELEAKKNLLESELAEAGTLKVQLDQSRQDLEDLQKQKEQVQEDYSKILAEGIAEDERLGSLQKDAAELEERIQTLRINLQQLEEKEGQYQALLSEIGEQEAKLKQTRENLSKLLAQNEQASRENTQNLQTQQTLQTQITQAQQDLENLRKQKQELQDEVERLEQSRTRLLGETTTLEEKSRQIKQLEADLEAAGKDLTTLQAGSQVLKDQLRKMDESQNIQADRLHEMQSEKNELMEQLRESQEMKRDAEEERDQLKANLESMTARLETEPLFQEQLRVDTDRLIRRIAEYLAIPSGSGQEEKLRDHLLKELEQFGGNVIFLADQKPLNLIWDIPASPGYAGSLKIIGLNAHIDRVTHTRTKVTKKDGYVHAEGEGGTAGFDDMLGVAAIMEVLQTAKEKNIAHPHLRIIFTAEEESSSDGNGPWGGARWLVNHRPDLLKDIDLLVPIDGPVLNGKTGGQDPDSPLAVKFINFDSSPERTESDSIYQRVLSVGSELGEAVRDVLHQTAMLGVLAGGAEIVKHEPKQFNFSGGDEREFQRLKDLRIAHLRVNYQHPSGHGPKDSVKIEHLTLLAEWLLRIAEGIKPRHTPLNRKEIPIASPDKVKSHEPEKKSPPKEKPMAPTATSTVKKKETLPLAAPIKTEISDKSTAVLTKIASIDQLVETITESIQFSYDRRLSTGEEFIINFPGQALRWIAFEVESLEWKLHEKDGKGLKSFRLF
ncbi:MAG: M20/M25/M40 family metallo-hydrolase, partial [Candidatus Harrisonbacteria bacterium]|nr:M20/M25/M40 family metallo-hydrolase [Candidatus Harrisonbacteria bacterium]